MSSSTNPPDRPAASLAGRLRHEMREFWAALRNTPEAFRLVWSTSRRAALIKVSTAAGGFAMSRLAAAWLSAPASEQTAVFRVAEGFELAQYAVYSLSVVLFLGIGIFLYGVAPVAGGNYPKTLGWLAVLPGAGAAVTGVVQVLSGPSLRGTEPFFVLFSMLSTVWIASMGVIMLPRARTGDTHSAVAVR